MGNGNYYSTILSGAIFQVNNNVISQWATDDVYNQENENWAFSRSRVDSSNNNIVNSNYSETTKVEVDQAQLNQVNTFADLIESLGYTRPTVARTRLGLYEGPFGTLVKLNVPSTYSAKTLEELEKREVQNKQSESDEK